MRNCRSIVTAVVLVACSWPCGAQQDGAYPVKPVRVVVGLSDGTMTEIVRAHVPPESLEEQWDLEGLERLLREEWQLDVALKAKVAQSDSITDDDIVEAVVAAADASFKGKLDLVGAEQFTPFMRMVLLQSIDSHWREHLAALGHPVVGDARYGREGPRLWLHAWRLQLPHPVDGRWITLDSGLRWPQATPGDGAAPQKFSGGFFSN